jgi:IS1 family transposase
LPILLVIEVFQGKKTIQNTQKLKTAEYCPDEICTDAWKAFANVFAQENHQIGNI